MWTSNLDHIMRRDNVTIGELATRLKIESKTVSNYIEGKIMPSLARLVDIADALNVTLDSLIGRKMTRSMYLFNAINAFYGLGKEDLEKMISLGVVVLNEKHNK